MHEVPHYLLTTSMAFITLTGFKKSKLRPAWKTLRISPGKCAHKASSAARNMLSRRSRDLAQHAMF